MFNPVCLCCRSLVALSLILAMLLFKPAPIYILDEVDAALDLSHTQNIGQMLRTHFTHSQVIRKSTRANKRAFRLRIFSIIMLFFCINLFSFLLVVCGRVAERRHVHQRQRAI